MTLLILPVRPGDSNEELRYALRTWETNLVLPDGLELLTVGYKPTWLNPDHHVEGNRYDSMPLAVFDNIALGSEWACKNKSGGTETALYMNDDFFCLDPVGAVLPVRRNATLAEHVAQFRGNTGLWWPRSLALTASWLSEQGFPQADSFEVHRPLPAAPVDMWHALLKWSHGPLEGDVPQWRTIYGVLNGIEAHQVRDAKLGQSTPGFGTPWVSTSDQTWRRYARQFMAGFQKPSRWEI